MFDHYILILTRPCAIDPDPIEASSVCRRNIAPFDRHVDVHWVSQQVGIETLMEPH